MLHYTSNNQPTLVPLLFLALASLNNVFTLVNKKNRHMYTYMKNFADFTLEDY